VRTVRSKTMDCGALFGLDMYCSVFEASLILKKTLTQWLLTLIVSVNKRHSERNKSRDICRHDRIIVSTSTQYRLRFRRHRIQMLVFLWYRLEKQR